MKRRVWFVAGPVLLVALAVGAVLTVEKVWRTSRTVFSFEEIYLRACEERNQWPPLPSPVSFKEVVYPSILAQDDRFESSEHWRVLLPSSDLFAEEGSELEKAGLPLEVVVFEEIIRQEIIVLAGSENSDDLIEVGRYPAPKWSTLNGRTLDKYLMDELSGRRIVWHTTIRPAREATLTTLVEQTLFQDTQTEVSAPLAMTMSMPETITDFRLIKAGTNISVNLPAEFAGATITLQSRDNLLTGSWTNVLQTNALSSGVMLLGSFIPESVSGGSSTNSGGDGGIPPPGGTNTNTVVSTSTTNIAAFFRTVAASTNDADTDGLDNVAEYGMGTDYLLADTSGDGLLDGWAVTNGLDPLALNTLGDSDNDGYSNLEEQTRGTNPNSTDSSGSTGTVATIRYYYDEDDRLTDIYCGTEVAQKLSPEKSHNLSEEVFAKKYF
jgi:hypothetical protein